MRNMFGVQGSGLGFRVCDNKNSSEGGSNKGNIVTRNVVEI